MIEIKNLRKRFKKKIVLDDISLNLDAGVYGLLGPNGAGKTTFIRCLLDLYKYDGKIRYRDDYAVKAESLYQIAGYLPQYFGAFRELNLVENLEYFCVLKNIEKPLRKAEIERCLKEVNLFEARNKKAKHLSGGMMRRLGIAQALLGNPEVVIFDEPTAGLDPAERLRFKMIVSKLSQSKTVIISTHIVEDIDSLCSRIIIMNRGNIVYTGETEELKKIAEGKTYEAAEACIEEIKGKHFIERRFEEEGEIKYRFVAAERQIFSPVKPSIEDGYICVLEEI